MHLDSDTSGYLGRAREYCGDWWCGNWYESGDMFPLGSGAVDRRAAE